MQVLNPILYRRLERQFGSVKVSAQGEAMLHRMGSDYEGSKRLDIAHTGEYYQVNCPYCNDTRHRLYVNHMYGQQDKSGRRMLFLATCYNEHCLDNSDNWKNFVDRVDDTGLMDPANIKQGVIVPEEARVVAWPGPCREISRLNDSHPARVYLRSRGFDPDVICKYYGVRYCTDSNYSLCRDRLIIPIFEKEKLKGWQARYIGELDWKGPNKKSLPPKYYSCPMSDFRSKCLYNFERMCEWETGIIVEGPTDVWNFGLMAGCIFGNSMTERQRERFRAKFKYRTGVVLLDPEEFDSPSSKKLMAYFRDAMPGQVCAVKLPEGFDPGSMDRQVLREYVREQAAECGVRVRYKKAEERPRGDRKRGLSSK